MGRGWKCDGNCDGDGNGKGMVIGMDMGMRIGMDGISWDAMFSLSPPIVLAFSWVSVFRDYLGLWV